MYYYSIKSLEEDRQKLLQELKQEKENIENLQKEIKLVTPEEGEKLGRQLYAFLKSATKIKRTKRRGNHPILDTEPVKRKEVSLPPEELLSGSKKLIIEGANVNYREPEKGETLLLKCSRKGYIQVAELLLQAGADANLGNDFKGSTPLIAASRHGHTELVTKLVQYGADVNLTSDKGTTPLMNAARYGHPDIVKNLIYFGADVNMECFDGDTALISAARHNQQECFDILVQAQAHLIHTNQNNETFLDIPSEIKFDKSILEEFTTQEKVTFEDTMSLIEDAEEKVKQFKLNLK